MWHVGNEMGDDADKSDEWRREPDDDGDDGEAMMQKALWNHHYHQEPRLRRRRHHHHVEGSDASVVSLAALYCCNTSGIYRICL